MFEYKDMSFQTLFFLMKLDYTIDIEYLKNKTYLPLEDRTLKSSWYLNENDLSVKKHKIIIDNEVEEEFDFFATNVLIEDKAARDKAIIEDIILPRRQRVFAQTTPVLFFSFPNLKDKIYGVVKGEKEKKSHINSRLQGSTRGNGPSQIKEIWSQYDVVSSKEIERYQLDDNFFYWLLEFIENNRKLNSITKLDNICFVADENSQMDYLHINSGEGIIKRDCAVTATLGANNQLCDLGFKVKIDNICFFDIILTDESEFLLNHKVSYIYKNGEQVFYNDNIMSEFVLLLFGHIIPHIIKVYCHDIENHLWGAVERKKAQMKYAYHTVHHMLKLLNFEVFREEDVKEEKNKKEIIKKKIVPISIKDNLDFSKGWQVIFKQR